MSDLEKDLLLMRRKGLLWAVNRYIFHPRGFALTFEGDAKDGDMTSLERIFVQGKGEEIWAYAETDDDDGFRRFEAWLQELREG